MRYLKWILALCLCIYCLGARSYLVWLDTSITQTLSVEPQEPTWQPVGRELPIFTVFEVFPWDGKRSWKKAIVSVSESHQTKPPWQCCSHRWRPRSSRGPPSSTESLKRWQLNLLRSPALLQIHSLLQISLSDYAGKYVVLFFYPLTPFTFVCPTEIIAFNDRFTNILNIYREAPLRMAEFEALGCSLIACSTDSHFSHLAW